jgi:hypothetical protein
MFRFFTLKYTLSAPDAIAVRNEHQLPPGDESSTFFILVFLVSIKIPQANSA